MNKISIIILYSLVLIVNIFIIYFGYNIFIKKDVKKDFKVIHDYSLNTKVEELIIKKTIVFDNLTKEELINKINNNLYNELSGYGELIVNKTLSYNMNPYIVVAIMLEETGCSYSCSKILKTKNNVGGMRGSNGYMTFNTLDEGINKYIDNLYYNYYNKGLTTPELMNPKYAESTAWASKINNYINKIQSN